MRFARRSHAIAFLLFVPASTLAAGNRPRPFPSLGETYDPAIVNNPATRPDLSASAAGPAVLRLQILLDRAHFSVGEIDGRIGNNTASALSGFRVQQRLPAADTGATPTAARPVMGMPIWAALNRVQMNVAQDALVSYTITSEDLRGPFVKVPVGMMEQAKLPYLGFASLLDELSERFHVAPLLLRRLNPGKRFTRAGEHLLVPNVSVALTGQAARIVVSKSANTVTALDADGRILAQYPCSSGSDHDPLPIGEWKIVGVVRSPKFHYNPDLFWNAKAEDAKATIAPGPHNPVGLVWIDLSKEHYGIHGTPDPALVGYAQSHGCIRLTNWDALQLASLVKPGTPVSLVE
jgi:lipoprotein-anchoring transpeptidase ErfK/SrfK